MATICAGAVQAAPSYSSSEDTVTKTCALITEAASRGVRLLAFPELWLGSGYPLWIWGRYGFMADASKPEIAENQKRLSERYVKNSIDLSSDHGKDMLARIGKCAKENGVAVALGLSEKVVSKSSADGKDKLYIGQILIDAEGEVLVTRRKLRPFGMERLQFRDGEAKDLDNVVEICLKASTNADNSNGITASHKAMVGMLSCAEHANPLLVYNTFSQNEQIHIAAWPSLERHDGGPAPYALSTDAVSAMSQAYAKQSQTFVLQSTSMITSASDISENGTEAPHTPVFNVPGGGNARIFAPDGRPLTQDLPPTEEGMVVAELELAWCERARKSGSCRDEQGSALGIGDVLRLVRVQKGVELE